MLGLQFAALVWNCVLVDVAPPPPNTGVSPVADVSSKTIGIIAAGTNMSAGTQRPPEPKLLDVQFRNAAEPFLPPVEGSAYDSTVCMNPFLTQVGDEWRLYYAGADSSSVHRIALATAPVAPGTTTPGVGANWTRKGVVLNNGEAGSFNSLWSVLPLVHKFGNVWHMYYSGRSTSCPYSNTSHNGRGTLQSFWGIGLATSPDGVHFTPRKDPVMLGNETREYPNNYGIAGGGTILEDVQPDGSIIYRQYYTLAVGGGPGVSVGQRKLCAVAHSRDGIAWGNHSIVMGPTSTAVQPREDTACAAPVVWVDAFTGVYHMVYSAIGTKWGFYSLAQAVSNDGYTWHRGRPGTDDDLILAPNKTSTTTTPGHGSFTGTRDASRRTHNRNGTAWDSQMVEYASIWPRPHAIKVGKTEEGGGSPRPLALFYAGNGYGATGIGYTESMQQ